MSPEQTEGKRTVDYRTDLWAIAVIVCECMTGMQPFRGETWGELVLNVCARPHSHSFDVGSGAARV